MLFILYQCHQYFLIIAKLDRDLAQLVCELVINVALLKHAKRHTMPDLNLPFRLIPMELIH